MAKINKFLEIISRSGRQAFRTREYAAALGKPAYARLSLHRLMQNGALIRARNGWWAFPAAHPAAVACEISRPCYVSFHSALHIHGLTSQMPRRIQLAVARYARSYEVLGHAVKEYKVERRLFNNFHPEDGMLLASPKKALADCLNLPRSCPDVVVREAAEKIGIEGIGTLLSKSGARRLRRILHD